MALPVPALPGFRKVEQIAFSLALVFGLTTQMADAESATWNPDPTSSDWNTAANWAPETVPNGPGDAATFAFSAVTDLAITEDVEVGSLVFNSDASAFTIEPSPGSSLTISGEGITNNSGTVQNLIASVDANSETGRIWFFHSATAGELVTITNETSPDTLYGGSTLFADATSAGSATLINQGGASNRQLVAGDFIFIGRSTAANATFSNLGSTSAFAYQAEIHFLETSTAANAMIESYPGTVGNAFGALVFFAGNATAGDAVFINHGATIARAGAALVQFFESSTAGNSTLIIEGGSNGGSGAQVAFYRSSTGGTAQVQVFDNGSLEIGGHDSSGVTVGSISGDGLIELGANTLTVGSNNLDTSFSGTIENGTLGRGGSITKIGSGRLILSGQNTYGGITTINDGRLIVKSRPGSATSHGPLFVNAGKLGGAGQISGAVTVGTGNGAGAVLSPGQNEAAVATLRISRQLTFHADGSYEFGIIPDTLTADELVANGVTIDEGAQFDALSVGNGSLPLGTVLTAIDNSSAQAISGAFANLPDGGTTMVGADRFEVDYEGGDGNDLTLTVVP